MSDTCRLFPQFGDPWPSCLLPSLSWIQLSRFLCNTGFYFHHQTHPQLSVIFTLASLHPGAVSSCLPLLASSVLDPFRPGGFIFQCYIFLLFIRLMGFSWEEYWIAIPSSTGPHFIRTLHYDPSILGGPTRHGPSFIELCKSLHHDKEVIHEGVN